MCGKDLPEDIDNIILQAINANGIIRNFSLLGGEPLVDYNLPLSRHLVQLVKENSPQSKIYLWTGYLLEDLDKENEDIKYILNNLDVLIDGPFQMELRDITLPLRGSSNQRVINMAATREQGGIVLW
jgi:anaerobic ribonucleoside-triphosphate reductase activating protein